jgi:replicative DNA helicase
MIKLPPHSLEAEQSVLGGLMLLGKPDSAVFDKLQANDFFNNEHNCIFAALLLLSQDKKPLDAITVSEKLESLNKLNEGGGLSYLIELGNNTPSASNIMAYADIVKERSTLRRLILASNKIADSAYFTDGKKGTEIIEEAQELFFELFKSDDDMEKDCTIQEALLSAYKELEFRYENDGITGLETGFHAIDNNLYGLQKGEFYIVAGRPAMGKSTLGLNIFENVARQGKRAIFFSLEMPRERVIDKMLSSISGVDFKRIKEGSLTDDDWPKITQASQIIQKSNLIIDDQAGQNIGLIRAKCMKHNARQKLDLVIVDYLQLIHGKGNSRTEEVGMVSQTLKEMSKQLGCPVLALSQLSRKVEERQDKRPRNADLRDSGQLEQDADAIIFLYRDEVYNPDIPDQYKNVCEVITTKARFGEIGTKGIRADLARSRFLSFAPEYEIEKYETPKNNNGSFGR